MSLSACPHSIRHGMQQAVGEDEALQCMRLRFCRMALMPTLTICLYSGHYSLRELAVVSVWADGLAALVIASHALRTAVPTIRTEPLAT